MERTRNQAMAHFQAMSKQQQDAAWKFFHALDTDGSGSVSIAELSNFLRFQGVFKGSYWKLFHDLDVDNSGGLDFYEIIIFYYIIVGPGAANFQANAINKECNDRDSTTGGVGNNRRLDKYKVALIAIEAFTAASTIGIAACQAAGGVSMAAMCSIM